MNEVIVSGIGSITAAGVGVEQLWKSAVNGISHITKYEEDFRPTPNLINNAGLITNLNLLDYFTKSELLGYDPFTSYALIALEEALTNANLANVSGPRTAVIIGSGAGGATTLENLYYKQYILKEKKLSPYTASKFMHNAAASNICIKKNINGPSLTIATACSASAQAIGLGMQFIRNNIADVVITGGTEAMITHGLMKTWEAMKALSSSHIKPFSKNREGTLLGEGAGIIILESQEFNNKRNGPKLASLVGYGTTTDGKDIVKPDLNGISLCINNAVLDAKIDIEKIDYINAHGTGTLLNDMTETAAIKEVFKEHAKEINISSTKPITGHTLGAAGVVEAIITIKALQNNIIPPTINYEQFDSDCDLNYTTNIAVKRDINYALSNSFAFGGINASLIFKK
jgi:nodulation protein E